MKKKAKTWEEIKQGLYALTEMSCKPQNIKKVHADYVFDEDKSVKWNKEQVLINNQNYLDEVSRLNTFKNKRRDTLYADIRYAIQCGVGHKLSEESAGAIWDYVCGEYGKCATYEIIEKLQKVIALISSVMSCND